MKVNFMNVGEGDMSILQIDNKIILIDVNISSRDDEGYNKLKELSQEGIIDYMIITHPHNDHIKGMTIIAEDFKIGNILESGFRFQKDKENEKDYEDYKTFINMIKAQGSKCLKASNEKIDLPDSEFELYCLNSKNNEINDDSSSGIHYNCLVIKIVSKNKSILFTGDSNWKVWKEKILKDYSNMLESDILHASHHGSRTFFMLEESEKETEHYVEHLELIEPENTIISAWTEKEKKEAGKEDFPPHEDAVEIYEELTSNEGGVYITGKDGSLLFELEEEKILLLKDSSNKMFFKGKKQRIKKYKEIKDYKREYTDTKMIDRRFGKYNEMV